MPTLRNRHLTADFDDTGLLRTLTPTGGDSIVQPATLGDADASGVEAGTWRVIDLSADATRLEARLETPLLRVTLTAELPPGSPVLKLGVSVRGRGGKTAAVAMPQGLLRLPFADGFLDPFEDEKDLAFDGAELDARRQLPPWRVFFREGHRNGLIVAARGKEAMSHLVVFDRGVGLSPHTRLFHQSALPTPMPASRGKRFAAEFEIGPWTIARHRTILRAAGLDSPAEVEAPKPRGDRPMRLAGKVIDLVAAAPASAVARDYHPRRWMVASMPWARKGRALFANPGVTPPPITVPLTAKGPHRVFVGIGNGGGVVARFKGDPHDRIRVSAFGPAREAGHGPFANLLAGKHRAAEIDLGVVDLSRQTLKLGAIAGPGGATVLDYVRIVATSAQESAGTLPQIENRKSKIENPKELSGFADVPDISSLTDARDPDPQTYRANLWEHARCGIRKVYWRIDGQCSDFPSRTNTMRYPSAKVHNAYVPSSKAYGRVLRKVDMLRLAADAARDFGLELWGWMRFNSYMGNVQSDFFKQHPQWHEVGDNGRPLRKLCLAVPEVRRHKIGILVEAANYGLAGVQLGFLRHPPVLHYHPALVESFEKKHGVAPPRYPASKDITFLKSLPLDDGLHRAWYRHRADFMTTFGRELRAALNEAGLPGVKVSIWVRPNHCLFDGIDLPAWLNEGLCDEVVVNGVIGKDYEDEATYGLRPEWKATVRAKAKLIRCVSFMHGEEKFRGWLPRVAADPGFDGVCTYESNFAVLDPASIRIYESLRKASGTQARSGKSNVRV